MTEPLTDAELDEIEQRAAAASLGPWKYSPWKCGDTLIHAVRQDCGPRGPNWEVAAMMMSCDLDEINEQASVNGPFIAAARTAVPRLAAEVRRLRTELARAKGTE